MRRAKLTIILILALLLAGCRPLVTDAPKPVSVYATCYPIYALTDALMADIPDAALHCLIQPQDGCLRSYQLSDWDLYLLASADAVICGGRGLESFETALFQWGDDGPAVSAVLYNLELYEGTGDPDKEDSHLDGMNPHLYMSVDGAKQIVEAISTSLMALDPRYTDKYLKNEEAALARLTALSDEMQPLVTRGQKVILMNEALIYLAQDLGLEVADWIDRESGEAMYGEQLTKCLERLDDTGARVVLIERQAPASLVTALEDAGYAVARLDILSTGREDMGFDGYIEAQKNNALEIARAFEELEG
ncbi:MAG: zinc ABC transporter substrate-binding protein [Clostridia bacterium]|nr:zinc ABC transporter substrate-binding protein [Clostridia bacterium]